MGSSNAGVSDDSTTISDEVGGTTHDTDIDVVDSSRFQEGERVLAFHSQQLYEAKVHAPLTFSYF